eukprot:TRINITY_DN370_c0_g1_i1.p2 TRINITY_DN370_c0_g1~~TRINITY_DN370_c0_g1_i1.p2  ORF type:complete len:321 (-),score=53.49 TRINITY_DN370_c0_g1_i1:425-1387(-)
MSVPGKTPPVATPATGTAFSDRPQRAGSSFRLRRRQSAQEQGTTRDSSRRHSVAFQDPGGMSDASDTRAHSHRHHHHEYRRRRSQDPQVLSVTDVVSRLRGVESAITAIATRLPPPEEEAVDSRGGSVRDGAAGAGDATSPAAIPAPDSASALSGRVRRLDEITRRLARVLRLVSVEFQAVAVAGDPTAALQHATAQVEGLAHLTETVLREQAAIEESLAKVAATAPELRARARKLMKQRQTSGTSRHGSPGDRWARSGAVSFLDPASAATSPPRDGARLPPIGPHASPDVAGDEREAVRSAVRHEQVVLQEMEDWLQAF